MKTAITEIVWPAIPRASTAFLTAQIYQLEHSQWLPLERINLWQQEQLVRLLDHARLYSPFYAERLVRGFWESPLLTRTDLVLSRNEIGTPSPASHGLVSTHTTSGSTGQPVQITRTGVNQLLWLALVMRDHLWHRRDFMQTVLVAKADSQELDDDAQAHQNGWGEPVTLLHPTGPAYSMPLSVPVEVQALRLLRRNPGYFLTYPTNLASMIQWFEKEGQRLPGLKEVRTVGETLTEAVRDRCRSVLGVDVVDCYSAQEVGVIALQCPVSGLYHLQLESLIVEILKPDGTMCAEGETGRVVVTDLHNFSTPILRYDIRDYATVGPPCPCGRGLPTLSRILGRQRNMVVLPDGSTHWPIVGHHHFHKVGTILQYQVVQTSSDEIEMRLVVMGEVREDKLTAILQQALGYAFKVTYRYFVGELPGTGSKFEEFVSLVH